MLIRKKLPRIMLAFICIPLLVLAIIVYTISSNFLINKCKNNIKQLSSTEGRALSALLEAQGRQVQILAEDSRIIEAIQNGKDKGVTQILARVHEVEEIYEIYILDKKGNVLFPKNDRYKKILSNNEASYEKILEGEVDFSDLLSFGDEERKVINITAPVTNDKEQVIGSICGVIYNDTFSEFTKEIRIDETGYAYILDENMHIIAHPQTANEGVSLRGSTLDDCIQEAMKNGKNEDYGIYNIDGNDKYFSFHTVENIGWTICVVQNVYEVQRQAMIGALFILITMIALMIIISIASMFICRKITRPIDQLIFAMERTTVGNFNYYCPYDKNDEFGILARHYNQMLRKLGESHSDLNRVCEELAATRDELKSNIVELTESKEALAVSEARYKSTLNAIEEVIWEYSLDTKEFFATEKWQALVGISSKNIDIKQVMEQVLEPPYIESLMLNINSCVEGNRGIFSQELFVVTPKNEKKWLLCKGYVAKSKKGETERLVGILTDITVNKTNEKRVKELAFFDVLTGCLNKQTFMESLDTCLSTKAMEEQAALLFVDLDNFKRVNDTLGHEMGDKLLNHVARVLTSELPQDTFISRFGGDEFVIFKTNVNNVEEVQNLVYTILNIFEENIEINKKSIHMSCSVGIALYPQDGKSADELLKNADTAMYKAKEAGKNSYSFYAPDMSLSLDRKLLVEGAIREALKKDSLFIQYQPIVDIHANKTVAAEALLRLNDESLGFISPGEFIPIAEETGLIVPTGDWVLENALNELNYYRSMGYENFYMTINVSSLQLREEGFLPKLKLAIQSVNIPPEMVKLEVTETALMENIEKSIELFEEIKKMGFKLALDDFGTGYSSLNYLRLIPIDVLKIDKSFIDGITTSKVLSEIVDSIINMAHALNIQVVAEGVETLEQVEILREKGCDLIQGYYFSKPLLPTDLEGRLEREKTT